eukprot:6190067-Pleurochrysis_carterae.AAC.3
MATNNLVRGTGIILVVGVRQGIARDKSRTEQVRQRCSDVGLEHLLAVIAYKGTCIPHLQ